MSLGTGFEWIGSGGGNAGGNEPFFMPWSKFWFFVAAIGMYLLNYILT